MFPVDVSSHNIIEGVPEGAFFAKVHRFLHTISHSNSVKNGFVLAGQHRLPMVQASSRPYVKYFNMRFQSSLRGQECAVWAVEQNSTVKYLSVYIAEVILVA